MLRPTKGTRRRFVVVYLKHDNTLARQLAHNAGQLVAYVRKHLALLHVPADLAHAIAENALPLSMAESVAEVQAEDARHRLFRFIVANIGQVAVEDVRAVVALNVPPVQRRYAREDAVQEAALFITEYAGHGPRPAYTIAKKGVMSWVIRQLWQGRLRSMKEKEAGRSAPIPS